MINYFNPVHLGLLLILTTLQVTEKKVINSFLYKKNVVQPTMSNCFDCYEHCQHDCRAGTAHTWSLDGLGSKCYSILVE
ncbi:unnamed protein product [Schistosoma rodhaini]|nr:unnamed protein product [Schistosoma rodhaini]